MQEACEASAGGMAAIVGLDEEAVRAVCEQADVSLANLNCPGQIVVSGDAEKMDAACEAAKAAGAKRAISLPVAGAYHSPLMQPAQAGLAEAVAERLHRAISKTYDAIPVQAEQRLSSLTASFRLPEVDFNLMPDLLFPLEWLFSSLIAWPDEYPLQGIRIGNAAIIATASELSGRLGRQVKRDSPAPFTLVASHCGDYAGYALAQPYHARKKLDASSIAALGGPSHGPQLVRSSASLLNALWDEKEKTTSAPRLSPAAIHRINWPEGTITDEERARLLAAAAREEDRELGLSIDPTLPQSRSHAALVGGSLGEGLRIDLYTAWRDQVRGASGARGDLRDTGLRLSAEIPAQLRVDLELGHRSSSWSCLLYTSPSPRD